MSKQPMHRPSKQELKMGVLKHPFELAVCFITILSIQQVIRLLIRDPDVLANSSHGLLSMPYSMLWIWSVMGLLGSLLMLLGLTYSVFSARGIDLESSGLWLAASMWLAAGVITLYTQPHVFHLYGQYFAIAFGCGARLCLLSKIRHIVINPAEVIT